MDMLEVKYIDGIKANLYLPTLYIKHDNMSSVLQFQQTIVSLAFKEVFFSEFDDCNNTIQFLFTYIT